MKALVRRFIIASASADFHSGSGVVFFLGAVLTATSNSYAQCVRPA
jgi:hypothetical protein